MRKHLFKAFLMLAALVAPTVMLTAQGLPELPVDPEVRVGKLPNGLTYYIRHNETPKGQASFYIAQKVGSILEEDNQRGLAHFLEHMCFNGTESFPGNDLINWLETVGVKFGQNLNAYTSVDETVYNISNVPVERESVQDSCLIILHDWADGLLLDPEEIDKERGVIHQEWRRSMVGQMRILEEVLPTMYPGSKYGYRLPIGTMEVVDNFPPQAIRDYYEKWYRPDQQGIIVVGDIDPDRIEAKILEIFSPINMPEVVAERVYEPVPDTPGTIYAIGKDKEQTNAIVQLMFKQDALPREVRGSAGFLAMNFITDMITSMLNARLTDMMAKPDAPFAMAGASYGNYLLANTKDAFSITAIAKGDDIYPAYEAVYRELLRAARGGFTATEFDRARSEYLSQLENQYNNRDKRDSDKYAREYVRHFVDGDATPGIEIEYNLMQTLANSIPVMALNQAFAEMITDDNRVMLVMAPDNDTFKMPTPEGLEAVTKAVEAEEIEGYVDEVKSEPLIPNLPAPGKIVSEVVDPQWDATVITLSNGVKVFVKPTQFKADEILFDATAMGGTSVIPDSYANSLIFLPVALEQFGLGDYTNTDLQKYLQGKQASVSIGLDDYSRSVSGATTPKDLPTLMELIYMAFTNFNITPDEFSAMQKMIAGYLQNQESSPAYIFQRDLSSALYSNPRKQTLAPDNVLAADLDQTLDVVHKMTANAADYTFVFVGNIDMDTFRPLLEQYVATLPADVATAVKAPTYVESLEVAPGRHTNDFTAEMQTPQTYVAIIAFGNLPYTAKDRALASIAGQILSNRLLKTVREDMGAVYSIGASGRMSREDADNVVLQTAFPMKPEMKAEVIEFIDKEMQAMQGNIQPEEIAKAVEFMVKEAKDGKEKNEDWLYAIAGFSMNGVDTFNGNIDVLNALTVEDMQDFMTRLLSQGNFRVVTLDPVAAEAE